MAKCFFSAEGVWREVLVRGFGEGGWYLGFRHVASDLLRRDFKRVSKKVVQGFLAGLYRRDLKMDL